MKKYATSNNVAKGSDLYNKLVNTYNESFADMVYPYNIWAEYATVKDKDGKDVEDKDSIPGNKKAEEESPLQIV